MVKCAKKMAFNCQCGRAGPGPVVRWGRFFISPSLALTMPISNNFQLNRASGETPKLWVYLTIKVIVIPKV